MDVRRCALSGELAVGKPLGKIFCNLENGKYVFSSLQSYPVS